MNKAEKYINTFCEMCEEPIDVLEDDEYFCGSCEDILREEEYKENKE
tara:strand:- start:2080 stop:2220 length:141 start_codon:yes stop_codon:yes gene_type:complete